jgi:hypothetical protein
MGRYWIIEFASDIQGYRVKQLLSSFPNGTAFYSNPITKIPRSRHYKNDRWIMWSNYGEKEHGAKLLRTLDGIIAVHKTDIVD